MRISARFWKNASVAIGAGTAFVWTVSYINGHCPFNVIRTLTFILALPGLLCGTFAPDATANFKDSTPWGPIATSIVWVVNISFYSGLALLAVAPMSIKNRRLAK